MNENTPRTERRNVVVGRGRAVHVALARVSAAGEVHVSATLCGSEGTNLCNGTPSQLTIVPNEATCKRCVKLVVEPVEAAAVDEAVDTILDRHPSVAAKLERAEVLSTNEAAATRREVERTEAAQPMTVAVPGVRSGVVHYLASVSRSGVPVTACGLGFTGRVVIEPGVAECTACIEVDERALEQQLADEAVERAEAIVEAALEVEAGRITTDPAELRVLLAAAARLDALPTDDEFDADDEPAHTLLVVPCSGAKLDRPAPAGELYRGTLTTMGLAAASVIEGSHLNTSTAILSALHGLVDLETTLDPYDVTFGDSRAITVTEIAAQLIARGVQRVVALTPNTYTDALEAACEIAGVELVAALRGCRGIGEQRGRLARYRRSGGLSSRFESDLPDLGLVHAGPLAAR